ncbi:transcriptional regulator HexR [Gynuella sunshinyii]|uniref:Transcriptional regulator n=1 Tax=Gynuella sunshinyii YC6258 TaxID=1445510 RepID=A0A0C5V669_9GAMM|nr:transcriptional regulator HexR [Gynuella sunshinyii]AJQ94960.1 transcriptional regulator [Gynuella sunshinyii YC6258]
MTETDHSSNLLERLKSNPDCLSKSEKKVAQVILSDPDSAIRSSIASLAKAANVSEPTVNRFCRSLGCSGFPDFKLRLAQCLATGTPYINRDVESDDTVEQYTRKIFEANLSAISDAQRSLDYNAVAKVVQTLADAKKIDFFGSGGSGPVALDAQHKFFRLGTPVAAHTDSLMQRMAAAGASPGDVIMIISNTGRTIPLIEAATIARQAGATVIGLTTPNSPLTEVCDLYLGAENSENTEIYTPMSSRLIHLAIIDVLATGVSLLRGPDFQDHLRIIKESLAETRISNKDK